jgi:hypothetical protein
MSGWMKSSRAWASFPTIRSRANAARCARATSWSIWHRRHRARRHGLGRRGLDVVSSEYAVIAAEQTAQENLARDCRPDRHPRGHAPARRRPGRTAHPRAVLGAAVRSGRKRRKHRPFHPGGHWIPREGHPENLCRHGCAPRRNAGSSFCGPDEAGAADAAARIARLLGEAERVELTGADLRRDPVRLADEARSVSLFGDRRQIHVRTAGDETFDAVETLLASPVDGWPVLIVATSATDKSRVAKLLATVAMRWSACSIRPTCAPWSMRARHGRRGGPAHDRRSGRAHRPRHRARHAHGPQRDGKAGTLSRRQPAIPAHADAAALDAVAPPPRTTA